MSGPLSLSPAPGTGPVGPHDPKDMSRYNGNKVNLPSVTRVARAELEKLDGTQEVIVSESGALRLLRHVKGRGGDGVFSLETPAESASDYIERLLGRLGETTWAALEQMLERFPGLENAKNPLAMLLAGGLEPGQAVLLLASLLAGTDDIRWKKLRDLRKKFESRRDPLKKALESYLKENGGMVGVSLFSFLEFEEDEEQQEGLKSLYRYISHSCRTMTDLFKHLMHLKDRETKLRAVLRAIALELSGPDGALSREQIRLLSIMKNMQSVLILFGLNASCEETAKQLEKIGSQNPKADDVLNGLIATAELAWVEADWLEGHLAMLFGAGKIEEKIICAQVFRNIWKKMPAAFFDDPEKRKEILTAFKALLTKLDEQEDKL